jgi:hypothetical protein
MQKTGYISILISIFILSIVISYPHLSDPLLTDETQFATTAKTIISKGFPFAYFYHNLKPYLSHPPSYSYLLSLILPATGDTGGRYLGLVLLLITISVANILLKRLYNSNGVSLFTTFLIITTPLVIPTATLLDIDGTILPIFFILIGIIIIKQLKDKKISPAIIVLSSTALFLCKLTTPLALFPSLLLILPFTKKRKLILKILIYCLTGFIFAVIMLIIYYKILNQPISGLISVFINKTSSIPPLNSLVRNFFIVILWFNPVLFVVLLLSGLRLFRNKHLIEQKFLFILGAVITIGYTLINGIAYGLPKYQMVGLVFLIIACGDIIYEGIKEFWRRAKFGTFFTVFISFLFGLVATGDYLFPVFTAKERMIMELAPKPEIITGIITTTGLYFIPFIIAGYIYFRIDKKLVFKVLIGMAVGLMLSQSIMMAVSDYSIRYNYGEAGIEISSRIVEERIDDRVLICPKDIAYHNDFRYEFIDTTYYLRGELDEPDPILNGGPSLLIMRASYLAHLPYINRINEINDILFENGKRINAGYFIIYEVY